MVGVDQTSIGGMWSVAESFQRNVIYNDNVDLTYIATATRSNKFIKIVFFINSLRKIIWILATKHIDIVHIHMAEKTSVSRKIVVIKVTKLFHKKVLVQMHAGPFLEWYTTLPHSKQSKIKRVLNYTDKFCVLGEYWKKQFSSVIDAKKIEVLYNGTDCPNENPYNINAKQISFFGHLKKEKGIFELLNAIETLNGLLPEDIKVNLCGTSDEFDIEQYINDHNLNGRVIFRGWVDGKEKESIIRNTAITVLPTYKEGLSMTVLESMANGIPVVTTNITTMPELLGGIVPLADVGDSNSIANLLNKLITDKNYRSEVSNKEFDKVKSEFTVDKIVEKTLQLYSEL